MRDALTNGGFSLAQTAVAHFGQQSALSEDYDYEYLLDCKSTAGDGPLAVALSNNRIQLRNKETLALDMEFVAHQNVVNELWASETTPYNLASCSSDHFVNLWDLRTSCAQPALPVNVGSEVWSLSVGRGDTLLVAGTNDNAHFFDVRTGKKLGEYGESHLDAVTRVRFHPTRPSFVVTASEDGIVCFFDCTIPEEEDALESILNAESAVSHIGFFGQEMENVFCLTGSETLDLWNLQTAQRLHHFDRIREDCNDNGLPTDYLVDCIYDQQSDELFLLSGNHDGQLHVVGVNPFNQQQQLGHVGSLQGGHKACVRSAYYDPQRQSLYTGGEDSRLCKWSPVSVPSGTSIKSKKKKSKGDPAGLKKARKSSKPY